MISGDRYENGLNSKTNTTLHVRVQHNFCAISLPLFCTTTTGNFQKRPSYTFCGGNVVFVSDRFFFLCRSFSPQRNWSLVFFISRSSSCSVIHVNKDNKIYAKERLVSVIVVVVVVVFCSLLKSGWPCDLSPKLVGA